MGKNDDVAQRQNGEKASHTAIYMGRGSLRCNKAQEHSAAAVAVRRCKGRQ
jgi:hypothetical protein